MERRRVPRRDLDRPAKIIIPGGGAVPVRICDESEGGAKLRTGWTGWLPKAFDLQDAFTGVRRAAHTVWRQFNFLGVRFRESKACEKRHSDFGHRRHD
jgi:hypothetical protein